MAAVACATNAEAAELPVKAPPPQPAAESNWTGFYVGGHYGDAWGTSNWAAPGVAGSFSVYQPYDPFSDTGSRFAGLQAGYDYMLPNRLVIGGVADVSFPSFPNAAGLSIGGTSTFTAPGIGVESYSETVLTFGSVRGRVGYAPGNWLFYATGGLAWTYDQVALMPQATGIAESHLLARFGGVAGAGIEMPVAPHWTASVEYLFTAFGRSGITFGTTGQRFDSDLTLQELRAGLNYHFDDATSAKAKAPGMPDQDIVSLHGQSTFSWQGYPAFRSPYQGFNSLPGSGEGREVTDVTLYAGVRLWQGAQLWINPEIDQGFGLADTHGVAGFTSAEAYKKGAAYPYARLQRAFIRQTIDLGGKSEKVDATDINQFADTRTENRLVFTLGRFAITDIFDTNPYANNGKTDFMNWSFVNAATFDYASDGWGFTYGAAAEWYQGDWTVRGGVFDLTVTPAGGTSPVGGNLDPTFDQFQMVGEVERRYQLWGQPGSIKVTGYLSRGRAGHFADAIALAAATGMPADINAVRTYTSRPGVSVNLQQQVTEDVGVFARAGWADGDVEPWDVTDVDRTVTAGASIKGKQWGRPDDTVGIAGALNNITGVHQEFFNAGGLGIVIGDGMLPHPGIEQIIETYYSYALNDTVKVTFDYQFIANPAYNTDRGPVNVFSSRVHWQF